MSEERLHNDSCIWWKDPERKSCTCGLSEPAVPAQASLGQVTEAQCAECDGKWIHRQDCSRRAPR